MVVHRVRLKNNLQKSTSAFKGWGRGETQKTINFGGKLRFILCFLFPERLHCCYIYIFTAPSCQSTIISLEPCAFNAGFQHFILRFIKMSFTLQIPVKDGIGGEKRPKDRVKIGLLYG